MGLIGLFVPPPGRSDRSRHDVSFRADGIAACDRALGDPVLPADAHLRRASLLQARAMHRIGAKDFNDALSDLDRSASEGKASGDPLYARSLGLRNELLRAYVLSAQGRASDAVAAAHRVRELRPYAASLRYAAARIAVSIDHNADAYNAELRDIVRFAPELLTDLIFAKYDSADWDAIIALRPQVQLVAPSDNNGFQVDRDGVAEAKIFSQLAQLDCVTAFALAAKGRLPEARALLVQVKARLDAARADLPLRPDGRQPSRDARVRHAALLQRIEPASHAYDETFRLIDLLGIAHTGKAERLIDALKAKPLPGDEAGQEVLMTLYRTNPPSKAELAFTIGERRARIDAKRFSPPTLEELYGAFPEAESPDRIPRYKLGRNFLGEKTGNGFVVRNGGTADRFTLDFGGVEGSAAVVQELALLRIADIARQQGTPLLIVLSRNLYTRETRMMGWSSHVNDAGYSAEVAVALFKPGQMPADLAASKNRVIDANVIYDALAPVYLAPAAP